jgi:sulfate adenylyltransferase
MESKIGITIMPSEELVYCEDIMTYMPVSRTTGHVIKQISGTRFRKMLENGEEVPSWYSYSDVIQPLQDFYQRPKGLCVYFMGLSGAGKSTLASKLRARIQEELPHKETTILDADEIRTHLSKGLGFSKADRSTNVRRIGYVASEIVKHGGIVLVANIAPFQEDRAANRALIEPYGRYIEVYVNTPIEECERRDVKGLYKAARAGTLANFTGVSDPFEVPTGSELVLTEGTVEEQVTSVWKAISESSSK